MNDKAIGQLSGLAGRLVAESLINAQLAVEAQGELREAAAPVGGGTES